MATVIVFASAAGVAFLLLDRGQSEPSARSGSLAPGSAFTVDTPDYRFVMPAEPTIQTVENEMLGGTFPSTTWRLDSDGQTLNVLALDFGMVVDDEMAQGSFDAVDGGLARRMNGTVVSQEPVSTGGVIARRTVIDTDGMQFTMYHFAKGPWIVSIGGGADGVDPPDLVAIRDSFIFK